MEFTSLLWHWIQPILMVKSASQKKVDHASLKDNFTNGLPNYAHERAYFSFKQDAFFLS
jgi:hypothetical protein